LKDFCGAEVQNTHANVLELMEVETAPVQNVIAASPDGIVAHLRFAIGQLIATCAVAPFKLSE
jgi:hypothetical protein